MIHRIKNESKKRSRKNRGKNTPLLYAAVVVVLVIAAVDMQTFNKTQTHTQEGKTEIKLTSM